MCNNWNDSNSIVFTYFMGGLLSLTIDTIPFTTSRDIHTSPICYELRLHKSTNEWKKVEARQNWDVELMPFEVINFHSVCLDFGHFECHGK